MIDFLIIMMPRPVWALVFINALACIVLYLLNIPVPVYAALSTMALFIAGGIVGVILRIREGLGAFKRR